jgi:parallel beta-helix repeat protein
MRVEKMNITIHDQKFLKILIIIVILLFSINVISNYTKISNSINDEKSDDNGMGHTTSKINPIIKNNNFRFTDLPIHDPIAITSDANFITQASIEDWDLGGSRDGSATLPFLIENYFINYPSTSGISIKDTTLHFEMRNIIVNNSFSTTHGAVHFERVINGNIKGVYALYSSYGFYVQNSDDLTLTNCTSYGNSEFGFTTTDSNNIVYDLINSTYNGNNGIQIERSANIVIINSNIVENGILVLDSPQTSITNIYLSGYNLSVIDSGSTVISDSVISDILDIASSYENMGIYIENSSNTNIINNVIKNINESIVLSGNPNATGIKTVLSDNISIIDNVITNISAFSVAGENSFAYGVSGFGNNIQVLNNVISNIISYSSTSSTSIGIDIAFIDNLVSGNTLENLKSYGSGTSKTYGVYSFHINEIVNINITNNNIHSSSSLNNDKSFFYGIYVLADTGKLSGIEIRNNIIQNIETNSSLLSKVFGIYCSASIQDAIYNLLIDGNIVSDFIVKSTMNGNFTGIHIDGYDKHKEIVLLQNLVSNIQLSTTNSDGFLTGIFVYYTDLLTIENNRLVLMNCSTISGSTTAFGIFLENTYQPFLFNNTMMDILSGIGLGKDIYLSKTRSSNIFIENTNFLEISWRRMDLSSFYNYSLYLDDIVIESDLWNTTTNELTIGTLDLEIGYHNYTILITDPALTRYTDYVNVSILDGQIISDKSPPMINSFGNVVFEDEIPENRIIGWILTDINPLNYILLENGSEIRNEPWTSNINITLILDDFQIGITNYTIIVYDVSGNEASNTIIVTIQDTLAPLIDGPINFYMQKGTTGNNILWFIIDKNPANFTILKDGEIILNDTWEFSPWIAINLDSLPLGVYNFTLLITDQFNNVANSNVIVFVRVNLDLIQRNNDTSIAIDDFPFDPLLIAGVGLVTVTVGGVVVYFRRR